LFLIKLIIFYIKKAEHKARKNILDKKTERNSTACFLFHILFFMAFFSFIILFLPEDLINHGHIYWKELKQIKGLLLLD
jgi:hypothetical protein